MAWPFGLNRARESRAADFADGFAAGLEGAAYEAALGGRIDQDPAGLSAALTAASIWSHALAGVTVTGDRTGVVTAAYLASVGRRLILAGEAVDVIETDGDGVVRLAPAVVQEVLGRSR